MLGRLIDDTLQLGLAQAVATALLALVVVFLGRRNGIHLERESAFALVRGFVQVVVVGSLLVLLLKGPSWWSAPVLFLMMLAAAATSARRAGGVPGGLTVSFYGIAGGAGVVIAVATILGVIEASTYALVPVGSMIIASSMNSNSLALERFRAELKSNVGFIEAGLALGATSRRVVTPYVEAAVRAGMIPRIDTLRSLGIVWIPGLMAGMILAGSDPVYAAVYQFVVVGMIYAASGLTSLISTLMIRGRAFTPAEQLMPLPNSTS